MAERMPCKEGGGERNWWCGGGPQEILILESEGGRA